jgi:hypothetical protein
VLDLDGLGVLLALQLLGEVAVAARHVVAELPGPETAALGR